MSIYITNTYALEETAIASRAQRIVKEEAKKLGIKEIRIPYVDYGSEDRNNMSKKIDGVLKIGRHTSELQSRFDLVCRLLLEKKKKNKSTESNYNAVR